MTENNTVTQQASNADAQPKRSAAYPALTVGEAYDFSKRINEKFSTVNDATREEIAHALGVHPNSISRHVSACVQYGFLSKSQSKGQLEGKYKLTSLFADIFEPENEKEKKLLLISAFGNPKLYQDLIAKFDGATIPDEFPNTLIKHHAITRVAAKDAADTFIQSGVEVGVINENRQLKFRVTQSTLAKTQFAEVTEDSADSKIENNVPVRFEAATDLLNDKKVPIHLTNDKIAYLMYPPDITTDDVELIDHHLKGIVLRLKFEGKVNNKGAEELL